MKIEYKIIALAVVCGLVAWVIDTCLDIELFYEGTFWELLATKAPAHELYIRTSILGIFTGFGLLVSKGVGKRRRVEAALQKSHDFLQSVIDGIPDGVMVIDLDHRIILANNAKELLTPGPSDAGGPMRCYQVSHHRSAPCDGLDHPCPLRQVVETGTITSATHTHYTSNGDERIIEVRAAPVFNEAGEVMQIIESLHDITDRKQAEDALRHHTELLDSIRRAQSLYITDNDPKPVFEALLGALVTMTESEYGFLDEVCVAEDGQIFKKSLALSNLSWDDESQKLYDQLMASNLEFRALDNLAGAPALTGELVISNDPAHDSRSRGVPKGHPPIRSFMGIPMFFGGELIGVAGLANRPGGYHERMTVYLDTFISTCAGIIHAVRDDRENKRITESLQKSEEQFRAIFDNALVGLYRTTPNGGILMANPALVKMLGFSSFEALSRRNLEKEGFGQQSPRSTFKKLLERQGKVVGFESAWLKADGEILYVRESARAVCDASGNIQYYEGTVEDISDRKQADAELKRASVFLDSMSEALSVTDADLRIVKVNEASCKLWGYSREELLGKSAPELFAHGELSRHRREEEIAARSELARYFESVALTKSGRMIPVAVSGRALKDERGRVTSFIAVVRDISEHRRAEEELLRYQTQLRSLVSQLALTEERERREIESVLHDDLLQRLALCKMRLDEMAKSQGVTDLGASLSEISAGICEMIRSTRILAFDLASPVLYDIGLEAAIRDWLDREVNGKYDVTLEFEDDGRPRSLSIDLRVMLYRAVRELCTNVIKHSQAERAKVSILSRGDDMEIIVEDEGIGMEVCGGGNHSVDFSSQSGLGLFGIRERLDHFGACMKIESEAGAGTRIRIIVPAHCQQT